MSDKPDIFMPLFLGDFTKHIARLTDADVGSYVLILMDYWVNGAPPDDDAILATVARCERKAWPRRRRMLAPFFDITDGVWRQKRVEEELAKAVTRKDKGQRAATARWEDPDKDAGATRAERLAAARLKGTHTAHEWMLMVAFCGSCVRCGTVGTLVKDHIKPLYKGGSDAIDNLQPLCPKCNRQKGREHKDHRPDGWKIFIETSARRPAQRLLDVQTTPSPSPEESLPLTGQRDSSRRVTPPLPAEGPAALTPEERIRLEEVERRGLQGPGADALRRKAAAGIAQLGLKPFGGLANHADIQEGPRPCLGGLEAAAESPVKPLGVGEDGRRQRALGRLNS